MSSVILITDCDMGEPVYEQAVVERGGYKLAVANCRTEDEVIEAASSAGAVGLLVQYATISQRVLDALPEVRVVVRYGVGVDTIDLDAAAERSVKVLNVPDYGTDEVADHSVSLLLALFRDLRWWSERTRAGDWPAPARERAPAEFATRTVGLLGFGKISRAVASRIRALGSTVVAHDPMVPDDELASEGVEPVGWDALWERSDAVSLHVPLTDDTRAAVNDDALGRMPAGSFLVNTARAGLVERGALENALENGRLRGAALDVWWEEPPAKDDPLLRHPRVLATPHVAWFSEASVERLRRFAAERVVEALSTPAGAEAV